LTNRRGYIAGRRLTEEQARSEWRALALFWKGISKGRATYYERLADGRYDEMREHHRNMAKDRNKRPESSADSTDDRKSGL